MPLTRREVLAATIAGVAAAGKLASTSRADSPAERRAVPMIHVSDLFRPHCDPDDHWDLASAYALAAQGSADLLGVLIDFPRPGADQDPDVLAVAQMNYLTGTAVPVMVGSPAWLESQDFDKAENVPALRGIRALLDILRRAPRPVVIHVLGSCRDVALAGRMDPGLFAEKCAAVYLNAGSGTPDPEEARWLEWNVHLDPRAYAAMFELPCPVYWMPCFHKLSASSDDVFQVRQYGTFYRFRQGDILPELPDSVQNFFAYMFLHGGAMADPGGAVARQPNWLHYLLGAKDADLHAQIQAMDRNMWCTGGFLHSVGETVSGDGRIVPLADAEAPVFSFDPVQVACTPDGVTRWTPGAGSPPRYIFHVRDQQRYMAAMAAALKSLLLRGFVPGRAQ